MPGEMVRILFQNPLSNAGGKIFPYFAFIIHMLANARQHYVIIFFHCRNVILPHSSVLVYLWEYRSSRLRANSPTTCQLAYVGEFTEVLLPFITLCYHFVNNVQNTSVFVWIGSALDERTRNKLYGIKCWVHILYNHSCGYRKWIKERGITHLHNCGGQRTRLCWCSSSPT